MFNRKMPDMVKLPAGRFMMGDKSSCGYEGPIHEVIIARPFAIGKFLVTFDEYDAFRKTAWRGKPDDAGWGRGDRPVINVSWDDAVAYTKWLSRKTKKNYRLPTEAEWEYACRAGSQGAYCFGDDPRRLGDYAWYGDNSGGKTHPVGEKLPNAWALYDMHGNVGEWCQDRWHINYQGAPVDGSAWEDDVDECMRVVRGGSWEVDHISCQAAYRVNYLAQFHGIGFRVAMDL